MDCILKTDRLRTTAINCSIGKLFLNPNKKLPKKHRLKVTKNPAAHTAGFFISKIAFRITKRCGHSYRHLQQLP